MNNKETRFFRSPAKNTPASDLFGRTFSDADLIVQNTRVARLLVLLQLLDESPGGLSALPQAELGEVISSAVRLCGFVNSVEAHDVISTVLQEIGLKGPPAEEAASEEQGCAMLDA